VEAGGRMRKLIADKAYDANSLRRLLADKDVEAVIPSVDYRSIVIPYSRQAYKGRNRVERMWCRLKDFRRVATRYDKLARNFLSGALLAATVAFWLIESGP
jgi:transposase